MVDNLWHLESQEETSHHLHEIHGNPYSVVTVIIELKCQLCWLSAKLKCHCHAYKSENHPLLPLPVDWEWRDGSVLCGECKGRA